ncbi:hypothetical protein SAMD00019534_069750 [Acytostelium subglobosum LB1]|uniref:hypothetical protein n=1 Tax=Acytostelium subglobosum LB1 TaxID=1410327 RepID=UPI0006447FAB|nr:hypothetical protein SAMD00019534_069750 [Acytostelium subglobosum LB1]GAM23800.1 hypothetical protein SAMD00019534_069750 [Acytostelium subglobosum LB1]|eukprot:XP_012753541.1 hypothetical protein SAMD00019534_069750 [Acytostelium subglobosum LB1]
MEHETTTTTATTTTDEPQMMEKEQQQQDHSEHVNDEVIANDHKMNDVEQSSEQQQEQMMVATNNVNDNDDANIESKTTTDNNDQLQQQQQTTDTTTADHNVEDTSDNYNPENADISSVEVTTDNNNNNNNNNNNGHNNVGDDTNAQSNNSPNTSYQQQQHQQQQQSTISSVMPAIGKRLNVQIENLESRITNDKYDTEAWTLLLNEVQSQPINIARDIYERFLSVFPTAGRYWKLYVEQEMASRNYDMVEKIFVRSLRNVRNVELWKTYITYIRQIKGDSNKDEVIKAFELAIEFIGMDISSTPIWLEYLSFLKEEKTATPQEEGSKKTAIRKLYQRALENPMHDLDIIWREYEAYEQAWNKTLAKALLTDYSSKYQHAKQVYRDRKGLLEGILRNMLAKPPRSSDKEEHQVRLWRKLIVFEKSNPQRFEPQQLRHRVTATYNQCLLCLYHYPDIWYEAAMYQVESGNLEAGVSFFERAIQAIPTNLFLHFSYADLLEVSKKVQQAKDIYERLVVSQPDPLVWIQYMRFARRTERVEGPRKIFKRAKSAPECTYHVYIALGFIEYYVNQDTKTARDIFELGLKKFSTEIPYVHFYVDFLTNLNEDNNTRVLFEKILSTIATDKSEIFWRKYLDFEYRQNQDLNSIIKLEKRFQSLSPSYEKMSIMQMLNRYKFLNLWPCHPNEIEIINKNLIDSEQDQENDEQEQLLQQQQQQQQHNHHDRRKGGDRDRDRGDRDGKSQQDKKDSNDRPSSSTKIPISNWKTTRPDTSLMIPYRNEMGKMSTPTRGGDMNRPGNNMENRPGGGGGWNVDIPDSLIGLLQMLPPASSFQGPWIDIDHLMQLINDKPLPQPPMNVQQHQQNILQQQQQQSGGGGAGVGGPGAIPMNMESGGQLNNKATGSKVPTPNKPQQGQITPNKRKLEDDIDEPGAPQPMQSNAPTSGAQPSAINKPPEHDIYRKRQASKLSKRT